MLLHLPLLRVPPLTSCCHWQEHATPSAAVNPSLFTVSQTLAPNPPRILLTSFSFIHLSFFVVYGCFFWSDFQSQILKNTWVDFPV